MSNITVTETIRSVNGIPYGGGGGNTTVEVAQNAHGLSVGNLIRVSGNDTYVTANASTETNAEIAGIVVSVEDVDNFTYAAVGNVIEGLSSLTAGTVYFLDDDTPGGYSSNPTLDDGEILKPVLLAINTTTALLLTYAGQTYTTQALGTIAYQDADNVTITGGTISGLDSLGTDILCLTPIAAPAHQEGCIYYDIADKTPTAMTDIADVRLNFCQESVIRVVNKTGSPLDNGAVLYFSGAQGNRPTVAKADADISAQAERLIGVATHNIVNNQEGFTTVFGLVRDINTSGWSAGDELWLSQTAGAITNVRPPKGSHAVRLGFALNSTVNGSIFVNPYYGDDLTNLHDVSITTPANLDVLYYDNVTGLWKNYALFTNNNNWSGIQNVTNTTDCTAVDTGALLVQGGAWIEKTLRVGSNIWVYGGLIVNKVASNSIAEFYAESEAVLNFSAGTNGSSGTFNGAPAGTVFIGTGVDVQVHFINYGTSVGFFTKDSFVISSGKKVYVNDITDCTAADTGALQVSGGAYIGNRLGVGKELVLYPMTTSEGGDLLFKGATNFLSHAEEWHCDVLENTFRIYATKSPSSFLFPLEIDAESKQFRINASYGANQFTLIVNNTTDCTAADTGSGQFQGGLWVEKQIRSGLSISVNYTGSLSAVSATQKISIGGDYSSTACNTSAERYKILTVEGAGLFYGIGVSSYSQEYMSDGGGSDKTLSFHRFHCSNNGLNSFIINGSYIAVSDGNYIYLRGDASTNGSVRISSQSSGVAIKEIRKSGAWVVVDSTDGCYAEIHVHDSSSTQSIPTGTTYTKTTLFTDNGLSDNCTADVANDKITVTRAGKYRISGSFSFTCGTNNVVWKCSAFIGGTESDNIHWERKVGTGSDIGSASFSGFADIAANTDIDVRFRHDQGGSIDLTLVYANLNVEFMGHE